MIIQKKGFDMKYQERILKLCARIIRDTSRIRTEASIYNVHEILSRMAAASRVEKFVELFRIESVVYGNSGECGLAVFMDSEFKEIIRVLFEEDSDGVRCWFPEESKRKDS
jgi:hypothetical protein